MSTATMELITWTLGTIIALCTLAGIGTRFVLLPYIKEHLITPVQQVRKQVTENHHANTTPTVLDRIDDVQTAVNELSRWIEESRSDRADIRKALLNHTEWAERWSQVIDREVALLRKETEK